VLRPAIQIFLVHLEQRHGNAGVYEAHGNTASHRAGSYNAGGFDVASGLIVWQTGDFCYFCSAKKTCRWAFDCGEVHKFDEEFAFASAAIGKREFAGSLHGLDAMKGSEESTLLLGNTLLEIDKTGSDSRDGSSGHSLAQGTFFRNDLFLAKAMAPVRRSPSMISSMIPIPAALAAGTGFPSTINLSACSGPMSLGQPLRATRAGK